MRVILTTIAFVIMTTSAFACSHLSQASRVNPTELSEYQMCWLDEHRPDEGHGVLGSLFYVKVDGDYVSMPISDLAKRGEDKSVDYVNLVVNKKIHEDLIEAAQAELEAVRHQLSKIYALAIVLGVTPEIQERVIELIGLEEQLYNSLQGSK